MTEWLDPAFKNFIIEHQPKDIQMEAFRQQAIENHIPIIHSDVEHMIAWLIRLKKISKILEVGTATGYSAIAFAKSMVKGRIVTIERNEMRHKEALENIKRFGMESIIDPRLGDATVVIENLQEEFDLIFIDASKSHYQTFLDYSKNFLSDGGMIISDNIFFGGRVVAGEVEKRNRTSTRHMRDYLNYISKPPFDTVILPIGDGLSMTTIDRGEK
jgi:predicted O-methyltransferase YrrM